MLTFLKYVLMIIGGLVVLVVVTAVLGLLWLRWKIRKLGGKFGEMLDSLQAGGPPPMRIKLEAVSAVDWEDPDAVDKLLQPLREVGFTDIGTYVIAAIDTRAHALQQPAESVCAVIYEHPQIGVWADLVTRYEDGGTISYANAKDDRMDRPANRQVTYFEGCDTGKLYRRLLDERPRKAMFRVDAGNFVDVFEQAYAEEMDWRMSRGGPTEQEIRRIAERDGQECTPELVETIRGSWSQSYNEFLDDQLRDAYLATSGVAASRWEQIRDQVVFVHDQLTPQEVVDLYEEALDWDDGRAEALSDAAQRTAESRSPRDAFAECNVKLPSQSRFEKIGSVDEPVAADVYLMPDVDDDDDE
jgi:hypothetical protein